MSVIPEFLNLRLLLNFIWINGFTVILGQSFAKNNTLYCFLKIQSFVWLSKIPSFSHFQLSTAKVFMSAEKVIFRSNLKSVSFLNKLKTKHTHFFYYSGNALSSRLVCRHATQTDEIHLSNKWLRIQTGRSEADYLQGLGEECNKW